MKSKNFTNLFDFLTFFLSVYFYLTFSDLEKSQMHSVSKSLLSDLYLNLILAFFIIMISLHLYELFNRTNEYKFINNLKLGTNLHSLNLKKICC